MSNPACGQDPRVGAVGEDPEKGLSTCSSLLPRLPPGSSTSVPLLHGLQFMDLSGAKYWGSRASLGPSQRTSTLIKGLCLRRMCLTFFPEGSGALSLEGRNGRWGSNELSPKEAKLTQKVGTWDFVPEWDYFNCLPAIRSCDREDSLLPLWVRTAQGRLTALWKALSLLPHVLVSVSPGIQLEWSFPDTEVRLRHLSTGMFGDLSSMFTFSELLSADRCCQEDAYSWPFWQHQQPLSEIWLIFASSVWRGTGLYSKVFGKMA